MRFWHQIALKPAKTGSTHDFTLRKQYEDKTKNSKKKFRRPGTVEISCFQKKIRGNGISWYLSVHIP